MLSLIISARTNKTPLLSKVMLPLVYFTQAVPFQYSMAERKSSNSVAEPAFKDSVLTDVTVDVPIIEKTTYFEPSFTSTLLIPNSLSRAGNPLSPGASGEPLVLLELKRLPVPSSRIVPIPNAVEPPVLTADNIKVSPLSPVVSLVIVTRTNKPPLRICTKLLAT